nr:MAG TPA: prohead serine protease [Caudoviricetes sp.]
MNTKTPLEIKLSAALPVALAGRADEVRTFKGTANSGKPFVYGGTQTVVDFEGLRHKASVPVLLEHSPVKMAGVCRLSVTADGLIAEGSLLSNEFGTQIAEAADQGFPWEMSVYVQAESFEMLEAGASLTVNGGEVHGPAVVMRRCTVREVSFTAVGVDSETEAVVLSDGSPLPDIFKQPVELSMTPEEKKAFDDLKAEKAEVEQKLKAAEAENRKIQVKAKLSAAGFKEGEDGKFQGLSEATLAVLLSADPETATAMIADLKPKAAADLPEVLLSDGNAPEQEAEGKFSISTVKGKNYV